MLAPVATAQIVSPSVPKSAPKGPETPKSPPTVIPPFARPGMAPAEIPVGVVVGTRRLSNTPYYVALSGNHALVAGTIGPNLPLYVIDVSNKAAPRMVGSVALVPGAHFSGTRNLQ
jgi:hypothetical protein